MGESSHLGDDGFELLRDVAAVTAASNTWRGLIQQLGKVFANRLGSDYLEIGWCDPTESSVSGLLLRNNSEIRHFEKSVRNTELSRILMEARPARDRSKTPALTIPLVDADEAPAYVRISLQASSMEVLSQPVVDLLSQILMSALRHCRLVERISTLSSAAHHQSRDLREELLRYTQLDGIVARSDVMRRTIENAELVARHDTPVLIRGESGTGKEVLARKVHQLSRRASQPFVAVNCGALPENLIESELFGHERGAFTGASARYRGRFERANNGTIFLDEIAELPAQVQVKLLRVLQEGELERLGGEATIRVNVRLLAATHRGLEKMIEAGTFREDLFYRINVFPIVIPPLRDRKEDIPALAAVLLGQIAKRLDTSAPRLSSSVISKLVDYPWPGNVRELGNVLERALIVSRGKELQLPKLEILSSSAKLASAVTPAETFDDGARRTIRNALAVSNGRIYGPDGAASRLGIHPSTLQGKMRKLGMDPRDSRTRN